MTRTIKRGLDKDTRAVLDWGMVERGEAGRVAQDDAGRGPAAARFLPEVGQQADQQPGVGPGSSTKETHMSAKNQNQKQTGSSKGTTGTKRAAKADRASKATPQQPTEQPTPEQTKEAAKAAKLAAKAARVNAASEKKAMIAAYLAENRVNLLHPCACGGPDGQGCSAMVARTFAPGHDAKLYSRLRRLAAAPSPVAQFVEQGR